MCKATSIRSRRSQRSLPEVRTFAVRRLGLVVLLASLASVQAFAFRARPVSDLRFDDRPGLSTSAAASDGSDFLLLGSTGPALFLSRATDRVFTQRVVNGVPTGPQTIIGSGDGGQIFWTGSHYLVSWQNDSGFFVAPVSREGSLLSTPATPVTTAGRAILAVNTLSAIVVSQVAYQSPWKAQRLDLMGHPDGSLFQLPSPAPNDGTLDDIAPAGDGYALAFSGWTNTWLLRIRSDGTPVTTNPTLIEGPYVGHADSYHSERVVVSSSGSDAVILIEGVQYQADTKLKTAVVDATGNVKRDPQVIYTMAGNRSLYPAAMRWDGAEHVVALGVSHDPTGNFSDVDPALLRISSSGDRMGDLAYLVTMPRRQVPDALAWNGHDFLVSWYDVTNQDSFGEWLATMPLATMTAGKSQAVGRSLNNQSNVTVGAMNGQYLVAWIETTAGARTVRASRLDAAGNYLDGAGIIVSTTSSPLRYGPGPTLSIDTDGNNWFVAVADGLVRGTLISKDGVNLGTRALGGGYEAAVRWNGSNYYVVYNGDGSLYSVVASRDGTVTTRNTLAASQSGTTAAGSWSLSYQSPALAILNGECLVTFAAHDYHYYIGTPGGSADIITATGARLDATGALRDPSPFTISADTWPGRDAVATDGERYLVVWSQGPDLTGAFVSAGASPQTGPPFLIDRQASSPAVAYDGHDFVVTWRRSLQQSAGVARIDRNGAVSMLSMRLDPSELGSDTPDVAASATMPALVAFDHRLNEYDGASRTAVLFATEVPTSPGATVPNAPGILDAFRTDADGILARFQPMSGALGVSLELRLADGTYRQIGVAAGGATTVRGSLAGLAGSFARLRAWNAAGLSIASNDVPINNSAHRRSAGR